MRTLSRLASVFLALALAAASLGTLSAHSGDDPAFDDVVWVTFTRIDDLEAVHPEDVVKYSVVVERIGLHAVHNAAVIDPTNNADLLFNLHDGQPYKIIEVGYRVQPSDLGDAVRRTVPLKWRVNLTPVDGVGTDGNPTGVSHTAVDKTFTINLYVTKRPPPDASTPEVGLDFSGSSAPAKIAGGETVAFKLTVSTGKYILADNAETPGENATPTPTPGKPLTISKQLYDADGAKVGNTLPVAVFKIPMLQTEAVSEELASSQQEYKLLVSEADAINDGGKLVFTYLLTINESNLFTFVNDSYYANDISKDSNIWMVDGTEYSEQKVVDLEGEVLTIVKEVEPAPTPVPPIGQNDAVTVTRGPGDRIDLALADGSMAYLRHGWVAADGAARSYNARGYIREAENQGRGGQTYAVVERRSDGKIVRVWISPDSPYLSLIDWRAVIPNYTFATAVVEAIPLDETSPAANQLARYSGDERIFVFFGGAWRWIPDIMTFQYHKFYWCDVTSADAGFFDRVSAGDALPRSGTQDVPDYPVCHNL